MDFEINDMYARIIEIWTHMDETLWSSLNMFLLTQGILFAGLMVIFDSEMRTSSIPTLICVAGIIMTMMWIFVSGRRKHSLFLIEHQARHLEKEIFANRIDRNDVKQYFPMVFTAFGAIYHNYQKNEQGPEPYEEEIKRHHMKESVGGKISEKDESSKMLRLNLVARFSSMNIITFYFPIAFLFVWVALFVYSFL
ncbi:MAG: hypothetical protein JXA45_05460 [Methanomassiliicoccales archaeon]|nr:hypothetical protein [Methanomassiliicoccales archaeon]